MKHFPGLLLCLLSLSFLFISCAHRQQSVELTDAQWEKINSEALEAASQKLAQMVRESKLQGPERVQHLATGLFLKGNAALMEGHYELGIMLFQHLTQLTDDPFVHKKYAVALIRLERLVEAEEALRKLHQSLGDKDHSVALVLAGVLSAQEKTQEAQSLYREILRQDPKQEEACLFLGKSLALQKSWARAEKTLIGCQVHHPKNGIFSYYLGKMRVEQGDLNGALRFFQDSHKREPASTQAAAALGLIYEQTERLDDAIRIYLALLKHRPKDEAILARLVQALFQKEDFQAVIPYAERLVDLVPDDLNMQVKLGILYTESREYEKAISIFRGLLERAPESDKILYYLGAIHQELERYEDAIEYFNRIPDSSALFQDSSFQLASMLNSLAQAEFQRDHKTGARGAEFLAAVHRCGEKFPELKVELMALKAGYFEAIEDAQSAVQALQSVQHEKEFSLEHKYFLAGLWEKLSNYQASTAILTEILEKDPQNAHAWNFLGYSLLERGDTPSEALPYIQKAVKLMPKDGYIRDTLGWYYYKLGRLPEALKEVSFALAQVPHDAVIAKHLALIHQGLRNFDEAHSYLQRALQNARLPSEKRELSEALRQLMRERQPAAVQEALAR